MELEKERLKGKIDRHLRTTARQLIKFDTLDETLQYLLNSFWRKFPCDFVAIFLKEENQWKPKVWKGEADYIDSSHKFYIEHCSPQLQQNALWWQNSNEDDDVSCDFLTCMQKEKFSTWFTVPLQDEKTSYGFCIIAFENFIPLILEADETFVEFGSDVAAAIGLAKDKESQKLKIKGVEWIRENIYLDSSIETLISKIVDQAGKGASCDSAYIYLLDEKKSCFILQQPIYGSDVPKELIKIEEEGYQLNHYFPFLEKIGKNGLTVPLVVHLKTIGVLHVNNKREGYFNEDDLSLLHFLSNHVAALIENARLYKNEVEEKERHRKFMIHHQELIQQTIEGEDFDKITDTLRVIVNKSIILFDRFFRPISTAIQEQDTLLKEKLIQKIQSENMNQILRKNETWLYMENTCIVIWPVIGSGDIYGHVCVVINKEELDSVLKLTLDHAKTVYAIQFIKQKLIVETNEQVKDSYINLLLHETIEDKEKIIQYSNIIDWDIFKQHRIAVLSIDIQESCYNLLDIEAVKSSIWESIKAMVSTFKNMIFTRKTNDFILISPLANEKGDAEKYWDSIFETVSMVVKNERPNAQCYLGIGAVTETLEDYYFSFKQAIKTLNIVTQRFQHKGFAIFDELGSYTVFHSLDDKLSIDLLIKKYLTPILTYMDGNGVDLFHTLREYLYQNGNLNDTAKALFIHRSTLKYRMKKIRELISCNIDHAEERFNLMMAFKLYDMNYPPLIKND